MSKLLAIHDRDSHDLAVSIGDDDRIKVSACGVIIDLADLLKGLPGAIYLRGVQQQHQLDEHDGMRLHLTRQLLTGIL